MKTRLLLAAVSLSALAACSLNPVYERPVAPVAAAYPSPSAVGDASAIAWRDFFIDPGLQALIAEALENNRDLRMAAQRIAEARALYRVQDADKLPTVTAGGSDARGRTPADLSLIGVPLLGSDYQVALGLASYELDFFGRVKSLSEAALNQYLATAEAAGAARVALIAAVAQAGLAERSLAEQQAITRRTLETRETTLGLTRQRLEVGSASALELRQNEILVQSVRATLRALERQRAQAHNALVLLVGRPLQGNELPALQADQLMADIRAGLPSDLLAQRPDLRAAEQRLKAANANIGAARAAFYPRITLTGAYGTGSNELAGLFRPGSNTWQFLPQISLPIFDAGRNQANLDVAQARKNIAVADYEKSIQTAFREVADALAGRATYAAQIEAQQAVVQAEQQRLDLTEQRFSVGVASALERMDSQRELLSAQLALVQLRQDELNNRIALYQALGGGLRERSVP